MDDSEKIKMEVNIGGQPIRVTAPFSEQDFVRDTEKEINGLYAKLRSVYPSKEDREMIAIIAYQYASFYRDLTAKQNKALRLALECSKEIDAIDI